MSRDLPTHERHAGAEKPTKPDGQADRGLPGRRRGGQELPDDVQDRPEQNAGYDAAVRGEGVEAEATRGELDPAIDGGDDVRLHEEGDDRDDAPDADERAERDVISEVRRRDRSGR